MVDLRVQLHRKRRNEQAAAAEDDCAGGGSDGNDSEDDLAAPPPSRRVVRASPGKRKVMAADKAALAKADRLKPVAASEARKVTAPTKK